MIEAEPIYLDPGFVIAILIAAVLAAWLIGLSNEKNKEKNVP